MERVNFLLEPGIPKVVGSFGNSADLRNACILSVRDACDIIEIRLDLVVAEEMPITAALWRQLGEIPLLFTARRVEEGGALPMLTAARIALIQSVLDDAAWIDVEVASIGESEALLLDLAARNIPWLASYHDFEKLPSDAVLSEAARLAKIAGATMFKLAAKLTSPADVARLAEFQLADHGLPVSTMGMGALAPVSRLLCAQCGSHFNYGFLGNTATAPGQWDSALLKTAISRLTAFRH
jgi:3-dehydroquinate dehydratase I